MLALTVQVTKGFVQRGGSQVVAVCGGAYASWENEVVNLFNICLAREWSRPQKRGPINEQESLI